MFETLKSFTRRLGFLAKRAGAAVFRGVGGNFVVGLRYAMQHGHPGAWASDHREETEQVTGWNYVAIRAKCIQGMQARVRVYEDQRSPEAKALRKRIRNGTASSVWAMSSGGGDKRRVTAAKRRRRGSCRPGIVSCGC